MVISQAKGFHGTALDHLEKLRRIVRRLDQVEVHRDDMDDFCKTAWHLVERTAKDASVSRDVRKRASRLRSDPDIVLCEHLANVGKHGESRSAVAAKAQLDAVEVAQGWGIGGYGKGGYGVGEQRITLKFSDGTTRDAAEFAHAVLKKWESVFDSTPSRQGVGT